MKAKIVLSRNRTTLNNAEKYLAISGINPDEGVYVSDQQELDSIVEYFGHLAEDYELDQITAAFVVISNGDYNHIWVTWSNRPYDLYATFRHIRLVLY